MVAQFQQFSHLGKDRKVVTPSVGLVHVRCHLTVDELLGVAMLQNLVVNRPPNRLTDKLNTWFLTFGSIKRRLDEFRATDELD